MVAFTTSRTRSPAVAVAVLTAIAFVLRVSQIHQSLLGDELFTLGDITHRGFSSVVSTVNTGGENSPPLFFMLAWLSAKIGNPTVWIRLPSVVFGTTVVPLVYALGRITVGRVAGVIGAAILTLSPYWVYYGSEARPYATLIFLVTLSTLALLKAAETRSRGWWAVYVLASAGAIYTHYTSVFVLAMQVAWSLWRCRDRLREPLIATGLIAALYVPWLPNLRGKDLEVIGLLYPLKARTVIEDLLRSVAGYPWATLRSIPTLAGTIAVTGSLLAGLVAGARRWGRPSRTCWSSPDALLIGLAVATPIGMLLYSVLGTDIWLPRSLASSIPAAALLIGAALASLPRRWPAVGAAAVVVTLLFGTIKSFGSNYVREPYRAMASYLDRNAGPRDPVMILSVIGVPAITAQWHKPHLVLKYSASVWRTIPRGVSVFLVDDRQVARTLRLATPHPPGFRLVRAIFYPGSSPTDLFVYRHWH